MDSLVTKFFQKGLQHRPLGICWYSRPWGRQAQLVQLLPVKPLLLLLIQVEMSHSHFHHQSQSVVGGPKRVQWEHEIHQSLMLWVLNFADCSYGSNKLLIYVNGMIPSELSISVFAIMPDNIGDCENFVLIAVNASMWQLLQTALFASPNLWEEGWEFLV